MAMNTPLSTTLEAALSRALNCVSKGYQRFLMGSAQANKITDLVRDIHDRHSIHACPEQRAWRRQTGKANAFLTVYQPAPDADTAQWLLLFNEGDLDSPEILQDVRQPPYLHWLGYRLTWHTFDEKIRWTWEIEQEKMKELFDCLYAQIKLHQYETVAATLAHIAALPGFHGVTEQKWKLFRFAQRNGYQGPLPDVQYIQKVKHGEPIRV